jgi:hypothetical protein
MTVGTYRQGRSHDRSRDGSREGDDENDLHVDVCFWFWLRAVLVSNRGCGLCDVCS